MSLSYFGLPPAVIRMKARRIEREERDENKRKWSMIERAIGLKGSEESEQMSAPGWVHEIIGQKIQ